MSETIALFDLDHTLLPIDSDYAWAQFTNAIGWTDAQETTRRNDAFYRDYAQGRLDMDAYIRFATRAICQRTPAAARAARRRFLDECIAPHIRSQALELLAQHRNAGHRLVLSSATNRFIVAPIGEMLGFERSHIMATMLQRGPEGWYDGRISGQANLGAGKLTNFALWLAAQRLQRAHVQLHFYSDSPNDLPLLEEADVPVATNPSAALRAIAVQRGWRVLDLFERL